MLPSNSFQYLGHTFTPLRELTAREIWNLNAQESIAKSLFKGTSDGFRDASIINGINHDYLDVYILDSVVQVVPITTNFTSTGDSEVYFVLYNNLQSAIDAYNTLESIKAIEGNLFSYKATFHLADADEGTMSYMWHTNFVKTYGQTPLPYNQIPKDLQSELGRGGFIEREHLNILTDDGTDLLAENSWWVLTEVGNLLNVFSSIRFQANDDEGRDDELFVLEAEFVRHIDLSKYQKW